MRVSNRMLGVIVDLSEVEYIDSYGLAFLFDLSRRLQTRQQRLHVVVPEDAHLRRVLDVVSLGDFADIEPSVAAARAAVARPPEEGELWQ